MLRTYSGIKYLLKCIIVATDRLLGLLLRKLNLFFKMI